MAFGALHAIATKVAQCLFTQLKKKPLNQAAFSCHACWPHHLALHPCRPKQQNSCHRNTFKHWVTAYLDGAGDVVKQWHSPTHGHCAMSLKERALSGVPKIFFVYMASGPRCPIPSHPIPSHPPPMEGYWWPISATAEGTDLI